MKQFKCKHCGEIRDVSLWKEVNLFHFFGKWVYVKCPKCGKRSWHKRVKEEK
jgi:ribosomal protein L37E